MSNENSAQPCGCDPGCGKGYVCQRHQEEKILTDLEIKKPNYLPGGNASEIRITDPTTGGQKGSKLARFDLIPMDALEAVAEVYGRGALKYADRNWERGYKWGLTVAALQRHLKARLHDSQVYDEETGSRHLAQVVWHALALLTFEIRGLGTNDVTPLRNYEQDTAGRSTREEQ